jgi:hypothetical protein
MILNRGNQLVFRLFNKSVGTSVDLAANPIDVPFCRLFIQTVLGQALFMLAFLWLLFPDLQRDHTNNGQIQPLTTTEVIHEIAIAHALMSIHANLTTFRFLNTLKSND